MSDKTIPVSQLDFDGLRPPSPHLTSAHAAWRQRLRHFVDKDIAPHLDDWDKSGTFPDAVYKTAADAGLLGMGFPVELGGLDEPIDLYHRIIFSEEFHRLGSGVVFADLATHWIGLPPIISHGTDEMKDRIARPVLRGDKKMAFAVTEPSGGSDVSGLKTTAERRGDHFIVNGSKTLISGAMRADFILAAVRTGGPGMGGISLLVIEADRAGISRTPVPGLTWYNASIGTFTFDNVEVPVSNLIGTENRGFASLAGQLNIERFSGIAATLAMSRTCIAEAVAWAQQRETFGKRLVDHQAIRHKLIEMISALRVSYAYLDYCIDRFHRGDVPIADLSLLKIQGVKTLEHCAREAMHILAGQAYQGTTRVERIFRESRIFAIGGGTEEILKDLTARQLGF
ncbi:acyl-CoA dehydrogenase family protein [Govanella unica]|uniref:Acyl-CoA dehydrogenase family protein n=1 Tax=Govanella unica TaxID=2975056 RepID=A0A9X3TX11_9PROT|nr:acyl-CoA dehydrogenase family protein [Govania unica]MDA5193521.1 acyl-CoA dehydrogenase family protein [Govania unica]